MKEFREPTKLTEVQFDETYGGTANDSPLHLSADQLSTPQRPLPLDTGEDDSGQD